MSDTPKHWPADLLAEEYVLGSLLDDPAAFFEIAATPEHFFDPRSRATYLGIEKALGEFDEIPTTARLVSMLRDVMNQDSSIDTITNSLVSFEVYVASLLERVLSDVELERNWSRVDDCYQLREIIRLAEALAEGARRPQARPEALIDDYAERLSKVGLRNMSLQSVQLRDLLLGSMKRADEIRKGNHEMVTRRRTGTTVIDSILGETQGGPHDCGLVLGHYTIVAAKRKMGKTRMTLRMALDMATEAGWAVDFYSLEVVEADVEDMLNAAMAGVSRGDLASEKRFEPKEFNRHYRKILALEADARFYFGPVNTLQVICRNTMARSGQTARPLAVFVDYLQIVDAGIWKEYENVTKATQELSKLAKKCGCAVIATAQFNRGSGGSEPQIHQLRSSGQIEQDVDELFILHRPFEEVEGSTDEEKRRGKLRLALNRHGPTNVMPIDCDMATLSFSQRWT